MLILDGALFGEPFSLYNNNSFVWICNVKAIVKYYPACLFKHCTTILNVHVGQNRLEGINNYMYNYEQYKSLISIGLLVRNDAFLLVFLSSITGIDDLIRSRRFSI